VPIILKHKEEIFEAIKKVLDSGQFILGAEVKKFEKEVTKFCGIKYAIGVASGTDALLLSLKALNIGLRDEVITTPFTFIATAQAIADVKAVPIFVDIKKDFNIDVSKIEKAITEKTKTIMPVHLFGKLAEMKKIKKIAKKYKLSIIEDAAQAFGTKGVGQGDCACFSFYPTKILGACGDAGMVITNNKNIADKIRLLRNHGSSPKDKYKHLILGTNSRLDEIQAAILRVKLKYLKKDGKGFHYPKGVYYPFPLHLQPAFKYLGYREGDFPIAEKCAEEIRNYET